MSRAQSHVVGVALLLVASTIAIGTLTLGVGELLESRAETTDAKQVAEGLADAVQPQGTTGYGVGRVQFSDGNLRTVEREVRLRRNGTTVRTYETGALRYETGERVVSVVGGAIVHQHEESGWLVREPPIAGSTASGVLLVGIPVLGAGDTAVSGEGGGPVAIRTNVSHSRTTLGTGRFAVAIETSAAGAIRRYFEERGVPARIRDFDDDGVRSVLARYPGQRRGIVVRHDLELVIGDG
jgi:hypothetical protein